MLKASGFEIRHQTLVHLAIVAVAFLTYAVDRDDIVWALVRSTDRPAFFERLLFALATLLMMTAAVMRTSARVRPRPGHAMQLGNLLFSVGLGSLFPLPGFVILVIAEAIVFVRLRLRVESAGVSTLIDALRKESAKWGLVVTMIVFTMTLRDSIAEVLAIVSLVVWALLNLTSPAPVKPAGERVVANGGGEHDHGP